MKSLRELARTLYHSTADGSRELSFWINRKAAKLARGGAQGDTGDHFLILCVKRVEYVALAIRNINSLHLRESGNKVTLYLDDACRAEFEARRRKLDYPGQVSAVNRFGADDRPWQFLKVEALLDAIRNNWILVDADTIWHAQPVVDRTRITFLVKAYDFRDIDAERTFLIDAGRQDLLGAPHFVTGFVSIPPRFYSEELETACREWTRRAFNCRPLQRISEEIGVNIAVQSTVPSTSVTTLKQVDGPNDRVVMQSLYYGCSNQIDE